MLASVIRDSRSPLVLVAVTTVLALLQLIASADRFPFSFDSASYIEQGRSLARQGTAAVTPFGIEPTHTDAVPDPTFPPGVPIILAAVAFLGLDPRWSILAKSWMSTLLLPAAIFWAFRRPLGNAGAAAAAFLATLSAGVQSQSGMGLTDTFALVLAVVALGLVLRPPSIASMLSAGGIAAFAYVTRNQQAALLIAVPLFLAIELLFSSDRRTALRPMLHFALGATAVIVPYAGWNLAVFGALKPYDSLPSTVSFASNVADYSRAFFFDLTAHWRLLQALSSDTVAIIALTLAAILAGLIALSLWRTSNAPARRTALLCFTYVAVGTALVILARTRYQWGELINLRHTMQYTPFVFVGILALLRQRTGAASREGTARWVQIACVAFLGLVGVLELRRSAEDIFAQQQPQLEVAAWKDGKDHFCAGGDTFLVSNWSHVFRIECASPVRYAGRFNLDRDPAQYNFTETKTSYGITDGILHITPRLPAGRPVRIGLFPGRAGVEKQDLPLRDHEVAKLSAAGWTVTNNAPSALILHRAPLTAQARPRRQPICSNDRKRPGTPYVLRCS